MALPWIFSALRYCTHFHHLNCTHSNESIMNVFKQKPASPTEKKTKKSQCRVCNNCKHLIHASDYHSTSQNLWSDNNICSIHGLAACCVSEKKLTHLTDNSFGCHCFQQCKDGQDLHPDQVKALLLDLATFHGSTVMGNCNM